MISPAKKTPPSAERYIQTKIQLLDKGAIKSSFTAQARLCRYRKHQKDTCPACTEKKIEEKDKAGPSHYIDPFEED